METDINPTPEEIKAEPKLQSFRYGHLNDAARSVSRKFCALAKELVEILPRSPERTIALDKLRESKDRAVSSLFWVQ